MENAVDFRGTSATICDKRITIAHDKTTELTTDELALELNKLGDL